MIDLIIVGRKAAQTGTGLLAQQLARKVPNSVMFVPDIVRTQLEEIFVPSDFSDNAQWAIEEALFLKSKSPLAKITYYHVYSLPLGYYKLGKTEEEFSQIMLGHAKEDYKKIIEKIGCNSEDLNPIFEMEQDSVQV